MTFQNLCTCRTFGTRRFAPQGGKEPDFRKRVTGLTEAGVDVVQSADHILVEIDTLGRRDLTTRDLTEGANWK